MITADFFIRLVDPNLIFFAFAPRQRFDGKYRSMQDIWFQGMLDFSTMHFFRSFLLSWKF